MYNIENVQEFSENRKFGRRTEIFSVDRIEPKRYLKSVFNYYVRHKQSVNLKIPIFNKSCHKICLTAPQEIVGELKI